ncbi:MAG: hypothetical protein ABFE02_08840 [Sulfuricella sp.]
MAETHVVSALVDKYAELSGLILDYQKKIDQMCIAVGHLDASIKLFAPDYDLRSIRCKVPSHLAVIATLMGEMADRKIDFREALSRIDIVPKKPRGAGMRGKFGGDKQEELFTRAN